eukprot:1266311-Pyramimonas_sp.AAC.1
MYDYELLQNSYAESIVTRLRWGHPVIAQRIFVAESRDDHNGESRDNAFGVRNSEATQNHTF